MFGRINMIMAAGQNRDRASGGTRTMRGGIDPACEARRNDKSRFAKFAREPFC